MISGRSCSSARRTRLTWVGQVFLDETRRVLSAVEQAKASAKAAATGYRGTLRIALSDGVASSRPAALLAQCREEEPDTDELLFALFAAGYGASLISATEIEVCRRPGVVARPLAGRSSMFTTYQLRPDIEPSAQLGHFIDRLNPVETTVRNEPP